MITIKFLKSTAYTRKHDRVAAYYIDPNGNEDCFMISTFSAKELIQQYKMKERPGLIEGHVFFDFPVTNNQPSNL